MNVEGTQTIVDACVQEGVKKLVFTSSAGTVYNGVDLINVDERMPFPKEELDPYNVTKVRPASLSDETHWAVTDCSNRSGKGGEDRTRGEWEKWVVDSRTSSRWNLRVNPSLF